jgi:predicted permease
MTLALGSAGVTTIFALVNTILLQPLPYAAADRLVAISHRAPGIGLPRAGLSSGTYFHYRSHAQSLEELAVYEEATVNLLRPNAVTERLEATFAGPEFFDVLGVKPELGRLFTVEDTAPGFMSVTWTVPVLVSHTLWQQRFGGDPDVVGQLITLGRSQRRIIGVMPPSFAYPRPATQIWILNNPPERTARFASSLDYDAIARLRPGVTADSAEAELARILPAVVGAYRDATPERFAEVQLAPVVVPLKEHLVSNVRVLLMLLLGGTACLLLVAIANTATLSMLRAEQRDREAAIRSALGARPADLVRLLAVDAAVLSVAGTALGLVAAQIVLKTVILNVPVTLPRVEELRVDASVVAFTCGLATLGAALLAAAMLLSQALRRSTADRLKPASSRTLGVGRVRTREALVVAQVALALALLAGSVLMARSLWRLTLVDPGFNPSGVLTVEMTLPGSKASQHVELYEGVVARVKALPNVQSASAASSLPLRDTPEAFPFMIGDRDKPTEVPIALKFFLPAYFQTMQTRVVEGRSFADNEPPSLPYECVVSASLVRRYFPGERALGKTVRRQAEDGSDIDMSDPVTGERRMVPSWTIVGVVGDVHEASLRGEVRDMVYVPVRTPPVELSMIPTTMNLVIRSTAPGSSLATAVRRIIRDVEPQLSVARIRPMSSIVNDSIASERFLAGLLIAAATASLLLTAIGVYGVVAHTIRRREREIGIRVSLGARPEHVLRMVLAESAVFVFAGTVLGLAAAWAATRTLRAFLFEVSATDPMSLASVAVIVVAVAGVASFIPARRALRLDPVTAIRAD